MKKLSFLVVLLFSAVILNAQEEPKENDIPVRKNSLKFVPMNLVFNSYSFEYERMVGSNNSLTIGIGVPSNKAFIDKFNFKPDKDVNISNDKLGIFSARLAFRHYSHKNPLPRGFYVSPSLKYQKFTVASQSDKKDYNVSYREILDVKGNSITLGFQMGYQFLIAKRVNIDFYFLGFEGGVGTVDAVLTSSEPMEIDKVKENADNFVADLPAFLKDKLKVEKTGNNTVAVKATSMPYPWVRSGISIGFAF